MMQPPKTHYKSVVLQIIILLLCLHIHLSHTNSTTGSTTTITTNTSDTRSLNNVTLTDTNNTQSYPHNVDNKFDTYTSNTRKKNIRSSDKELRSIEEKRRIVPDSDGVDIKINSVKTRDSVHVIKAKKKRSIHTSIFDYPFEPIVRNASLRTIDRRDIQHLPSVYTNNDGLSLYESKMLDSALNSMGNTTSYEDIPSKRELISHAIYTDADRPPSYEDDRHNVLRRKLLHALSKRIEARNLLMHEKALLRQRMLQDRLEQARNNINDFHGDGRGDVLHSETDIRGHEISNPTPRIIEPDIIRNNMNDFHTDNGGERLHHLDAGNRGQEIYTPYNDESIRRDEPSNSPEEMTPPVTIEPLRKEHRILPLVSSAHPSPIVRLRDNEILPVSNEDSVRRGDIVRNYEDHNNRYAYPVRQQQQQSDSIFDEPNDSMLPTHRLYQNVGNLGDETLPYGSLGSTKEEYMKADTEPDIDQDPEMLSHVAKATGRDDEELLPTTGRSLPKEKKTWVTDVNVYSKKKPIHDVNDLFNEEDEDNEAMDEYDPCERKPCINSGQCKIVGSTRYLCVCPRKFRGKHCQTRNHCHPNPCGHGSKCTEVDAGFKCSCIAGFKGKRCKERNFCIPNPCGENGDCTVASKGAKFACTCKTGWYGKLCELPKPDSSLENIAHTFNIGVNHTSSKSIVKETNVKSSISFPPAHPDIQSPHPAACLSHPCLNGASCIEDTTSSYGFTCNCKDNYSGEICEEKKCQCKNGGTCIGEGLEIKCLCRGGYGGNECQEHTQCNEDTCLHGGICVEQVGGFKCKCDSGYKGQRCQEEDRCKPNPCFHGGVCKDYGDFHQCECQRGFKGKQCEDLDLCEPNPCQNNGECFGYTGGYQCECKGGFSGKDCADKLHCVSNPCSNGAECIEIHPGPENTEGTYKCGCKTGFIGKTCESEDFCHSLPCHNGGTCITSNDGFVCSCTEQYSGQQCQLFNHCYQNPCRNKGKCMSGIDDYVCECKLGFKGGRCEDVDYCLPNPCKNNGFCAPNDADDGFVCHCSEGYQGLTCDVADPCFPNPCAHGNCSDVAGGFVCKCTIGFKGPTCSDVDHCDPNPCFHDGSCEEINGGEGFVCSCPYGYKGKMCEKKDLCHPNPCLNDGLCEEYSSSAPFYYGHKRYSRDSVEEVDNGGVDCTCMKGYHGKRCDEIDPCYPNPCLHHSTCVFNGRYPVSCNCSMGWKGEHCQLVDLCAPDPCRYGTHCLQNDEESYQCVRNLCIPNPCANYGKCIVVNDESYECACPKGFRGALCEEADSCQPNPCDNGGVCHNVFEGGVECVCKPEYSGTHCTVPEKKQKSKTYCDMIPCKNGGTCIDTEGGFTCRCTYGFAGPFCEDSVCFPSPCDNDGVCVPYYGIALCKCLNNYTGAHCSESKSATALQPLHYNLKDVQSVTKSLTPHVLTEQLKNLDPSSPALIARVEEILNSYKETKQQRRVENAAINNVLLQTQLAREVIPAQPQTPAAENNMSISPYDRSYNQTILASIPSMINAPIMNPETGQILEGVPGRTQVMPNPANSPLSTAFAAASAPAPVPAPVPAAPAAAPATTSTPASTSASAQATAAAPAPENAPVVAPETAPAIATETAPPTTQEPAQATAPATAPVTAPATAPITTSVSSTSSKAKAVPAEAEVQISEKEKVKFETVASVPETNPKMAAVKLKEASSAQSQLDSTGEKNDKFESVGAVPETNPNIAREAKMALSQLPHQEIVGGVTDKFETVGSVPDKCEPNPCHHGGTCVIRSNGDPECICKNGFSGPDCSDIGKFGYSSGPKFFPKDECDHCDKEAICVNEHCICDKGFVGDGLECWPETVMDRRWDCEPNPCKNGGTCKKGRARCVCKLGFIGLFCEEYCEPCVHLSFDRTNGPYIIDESGHHNNAIMKNGAFIANNGGKCDSGVSPSGGDVLFGGKHFSPKPYDAVTMVAWIKVDTTSGIQAIFDTVGGTLSTHREGQYHLEVDNTRIRWFHRNERHSTIYSVISGSVITPQNWTHIAGTYNAGKRLAMLYVNGDLVGTNTNVGTDINLSQDWDTKAGLGRHEHTFGNRVFHGVIDEFYIFPCTLPRLEILVLMHHCKVYWKHKEEPETRRLPQDPVFDVDTALLHQNPGINAQSVMALSETAKALEKDLKKFQNYYGFNQDLLTNHASKETETTGDSRFQISKPAKNKNVYSTSKSDTAKRPPKIDKKVKKVKADEYMSVLPNGPTSMISEIQGILTADKRMQISPEKRVPDAKKLNPKNGQSTFSKYHRAPVVRNENKVLPFGPHAYFQLPNAPQAPSEFARGLAKSSFPRNPKAAVKIIGPSVFGQHADKVGQMTQKSNVEQNKLSPRWFTWTKGLATTNGVTTTNTHSNSNQNEPGSVSMNNRVTSSQQSSGSTDVKNMYGVPKNLIMSNGHLNYLILNPSSVSQNTLMELQRVRDMAVHESQLQKPANANANTRLLQIQRARQIAVQKRLRADRIRYAAKQKQVMLNAQKTRNILVQRNAAILRAQQVQQYQQKQHVPTLQKKEVYTTEHKHQWGFGNGNGQGNGVGTPGASGSGGGWGAGGPLNSKVNFPGWQGSPPSRFTAHATENAPFPAITREMWNSFLAQKRQSNSNVHTETVNTAQSSVNIQPANGVQNGKVSAHQWGFGNGQGQGNGQGTPGGTGNGGGWGAGGPTKQNTWLPNQRSVIHSSRLPIAIAQSFKAPWLPQNDDKLNNAHALSSHTEIRGHVPPPLSPNLNYFQTMGMQRSHIPSPPVINRRNNHRVLNPTPRILDTHRKVAKKIYTPLQKKHFQYMNMQKGQRYSPRLSISHSQPLTLEKHTEITRVLPIQYHRGYVVPPSLTRSRVYPLYNNKHLKRSPYTKSRPILKRTNVPAGAIHHRSEVVDPLSKHMTPQGIIEALPFLKRK